MIKAQIVQILPIGPFDKAFDYSVPDGQLLDIGSIVEVPFGKRNVLGCVWSENPPETPPAKIKSVTQVFDVPPLAPALIQFVEKAAAYTMVARGNILKMVLNTPKALEPPAAIIGYMKSPGDGDSLRLTAARQRVLDIAAEHPGLTLKDLTNQSHASTGVIKGLVEAGALTQVELTPESHTFPDIQLKPVQLSDYQEAAAAQLIHDVEGHQFKPTLLDGITGSGKTEVFFEAIAAALKQKRQVLVLLPEIALTPQLEKRFTSRFGFVPAIWHSDVSAGNKVKTWRGVVDGSLPIVVGARSALFLPFKNLGLIVVDEEHDSSYKQEEGTIYHGRDMAVLRAHLEAIPIVLASATPSLETIANALEGRYQHVHLPERHGAAVLPEVQLIDLRKEKLTAKQWLSPQIKEALTQTLAQGEQALIFLNRRGYAPLTLCRTCGHRLQCPHCTAWLVSHRQFGSERLLCHHCGHQSPLPKKCPSCEDEDSFAVCGPGVERIAEEVASTFPDARTLTLASDTVNSAKQLHQMLDSVADKRVDIIIGTQIVAKGHHFPDLTLVGIVDADLGLAGGDPRATERSFQLLHQVSGRAGRGDKPGRVLIQTYLPENKLMQFLQHHDRDGFIATELKNRASGALPPHGRLATVTIAGPQANAVQDFARQLARSIPTADGVKILGPATPPLAMVRGNHRQRFLLKGGKNTALQKVIHAWLNPVKTPPRLKIQIDIDPVSFL